jgi:hypothetical protein
MNVFDAALIVDSSRRLTFMCGFWTKISARPRGVDQPGPGQPFPDLAQTKYTWYVCVVTVTFFLRGD